MDLWELCDESLSLSGNANVLEQALVHVKENEPDKEKFVVNKQLVNSKEYHDKFKEIDVPRRVQECLYRETGRLLDFVDGQAEERLLAINARTGDFIVDNFNRAGSEKRTSFIASERMEIDKCKDPIILVHNHSLNGRPSGKDLLSFLHQENVALSLVACHDGTVYEISYVSPKFEKMFYDRIEYYKTNLSDMDEIKRLSLTDLIIENDMISDKHKLFKIRRL